MTPPNKIPYLHVRSVHGFLFPKTIAITGNARALLQLRVQVDRALKGGAFPYDDTIYSDVLGQECEVVVKLARRHEELEEPVPRPEKTPEKLPCAKMAQRPK